MKKYNRLGYFIGSDVHLRAQLVYDNLEVETNFVTDPGGAAEAGAFLNKDRLPRTKIEPGNVRIDGYDGTCTLELSGNAGGSTASEPKLTLNRQGANGADGDRAGTIIFECPRDDSTTGQAITALHSSWSDVSEQYGRTILGVHAGSGAGVRYAPIPGLENLAGTVIEGVATAVGQVDVLLAKGAASTTTVAGDLSITTGLILDSVDITTIQTSSELSSPGFQDNDTSLLTAAAIDDRINAASGGISFDGSTANGVLTFKDSDEATVEANMIYDGDDLTLTSTSASKPILAIQTTHTHSGRAGELRFIKDADDTSNGEALGFITFYGDDDAGNNQQFAKIKAEIEESASGSEGGKLTLMVASHNGSEIQGLVIEDGDVSSEVDVTLGNGSNSTVTCPGKLVAKTIQCFSSNFFDDIGTTKHYVPLSTQSTSEQTSDGNTFVDFLAPCDLSIREVMLKLPASTTGSGNITAGIETSNIGSTPVTKSSVETETVAVTSSNDNDIVHFRFDEVTHATLGQNVAVTIQSDTDLSSSQNWYVNVIMELDWNTMHTGSSSVQTS